MKLSVRERFLLLILVILVIGLSYYMFVKKPLEENMASVESEISTTENSILLTESRISEYKAMALELEEMESSQSIVPISEYDNLAEVMRSLTNLLAPTGNYSIQFGKLTEDENGIVRRPVQVSYTVGSYEDATNLYSKIENMEFRNLISDFSLSIQGTTSDASSSKAHTVSMLVTFYEYDSNY